MANILLGGGITDARGSIGGTTFSRNKGGNYIRNRTKPVNPRSPLQNARRATIAYLTRFWSNTLTEDQRTDWRAYAKGTTWTNKLAQVVEINGLAAFVRLNALRRMVGAIIWPDAPTAMGHAGGVEFTFAAESDTRKIQIDEPTGSFDPTRANSFLAVSMGLPCEPGRIAIPKGFRYIGLIVGKAAPPPDFPFELPAAYTMREGQFITCSCMFQDEWFRVAGPFFATDLAAPHEE